MEFRLVRHTTNFDAGCEFYGATLGWPVTREWDSPQRGRIFGYGIARVELLESEADEPVTGLFLSVEVDDVDHSCSELARAGITITQPLGDQPWGQRNFAVMDPSGMKVVFFQWI